MLGFEDSEVAHKLSAKSSPILSSFLINVIDWSEIAHPIQADFGGPDARRPAPSADGAGLLEETRKASAGQLLDRRSAVLDHFHRRVVHVVLLLQYGGGRLKRHAPVVHLDHAVHRVIAIVGGGFCCVLSQVGALIRQSTEI